MAAVEVPVRNLPQFGQLSRTRCEPVPAPRIESAAPRYRDHRRWRALDRDELLESMLDRRHGAEKTPRVRVLRRLEQLACRPELHDASRVHDEHGLGGLR